MKGEGDFEALLAESGQDELWLVSYADLLTLLIGFFVLLLSISPVKLSRLEALAASISGGAPAPLEALQAKVEQLIAEQRLAGEVLTHQDNEGLAIEFKDALLFDSGSAVLRPHAQEVIARLAGMLQQLPARPVSIEGHSDDVPIANATFRSNWELSAERAIQVLDTLEASGVERARMSVRGFADTRPALTQGPIDQQRAANRRVVIRVE